MAYLRVKSIQMWDLQFESNSNSVFCTQCGKWIHSRCAGVKRVTQIIYKKFACRQCEGNIGRQRIKKESYEIRRKQEGNLHILVTWVSAGGGREAAVTVRTRYGWVKLRECVELFYGRRFPLKLKGLFT